MTRPSGMSGRTAGLSSIRAGLRSAPVLGAWWARFRSWQLDRTYAQRREHYAMRASENGLRYDEDATISEIRSRIHKRGYAPTRRGMNDVHTFALIPQFSWHKHLLPDLRELGPVTLF